MIKKIRHVARTIESKIREAKKARTRSPQWARVRDEFLSEQDSCAACGSRKNLQVHHVKPFHLHPELELDPENLITLCMDDNECHIDIGHGDSFRAYNPNVREDAADFMRSGSKTRRIIEARAKAQRLID